MDLTVKQIREQQFWIHSKVVDKNGIRTTTYHAPTFLEKINNQRIDKINPNIGKTIGGFFAFGQDYENILLIYTDRTINNYASIIPLHIVNIIEQRLQIIHLPHVEEKTHQSLQTSPEPALMPPAQPPSYSAQ